MRSFKDINEARGDNTAVFTFGRFNPPTTGHGKLLDALAKQAKKNGAPYYVFASHSENAKKDPLPYVKKVAYMKKMFPKHARSIFVDKARQVFEVAVSLYNKGHKSVVMVVGSDRVAEFDGLLKKYNKMEGRHGYYEFENIQVISAGERDPDSEGVSGMSASKMRASAVKNQYLNVVDVRGKVKEFGFEAGLPKGFGQGMSLFKDVRKFMGVRESFVPRTNVMTDEDVVRDLYMENKIFCVGDIVEDNYTGVSGEIVRRGTNYITFKEEDGTFHKKWLYEVKQTKETKGRDYKKEYQDYQGTPEQIARRSSRNKARRVMGDKVVKGMDVGHKDNNPLNNDPSNLRNEDPSVNRKEPRLREVKQDKSIKDREGTQPAKYYAKDTEGDAMAKSTKQARARHFDKNKKGPAPGDASATTKPSTHTQKFKQMYGEILGKDADMGDYIDDFAKSDAPQFKGKSKEKRKDMAIAAYLDKNESLLDKVNTLLSEDGHTDVASMKGKVQVAMKALQKMQSELGKLGDEDDLPTWWTNKVSTAVSRIDDMSDYLDTQVEDFTHYPGQVDSKQDKSKGAFVKGDPSEPIEFDGNDTKSILDKANKEVEKERGVKQKPMVEFYQLDEKIEGLVTKAKKSGMPYGILKKVYDRGMAAWKTGHRPGTTPQQWAFARVNSFTTKSSGTWGKADSDLAKQVRGS